MVKYRSSKSKLRVQFSPQPKNICLIGGKADALVSKTNSQVEYQFKSDIRHFILGCGVNGNIVGLGPIDASSSLATLNWDVAKSGKALDFDSNIYGFKSHRPNNPALV
jgi:hypothetical protein